jgi:hypothetical protein
MARLEAKLDIQANIKGSTDGILLSLRVPPVVLQLPLLMQLLHLQQPK